MSAIQNLSWSSFDFFTLCFGENRIIDEIIIQMKKR